ncbi:type II toxin-antitoxin system VapC family toxin [Myxosarcina sp. GI1]|uniref:type II toxin-antitoxin system VapC family toxin n=1 Tax=Myxosarcina sp. GI1 TaxID=1541065 RepID=UPI000AD1A205|nr:PIN domain-containing protein [Myxosarcina sp. GI1]
MYYAKILVDSGFLIAYYSAGDRYHQQVSSFLETCTAQLTTTPMCVTEVMWLLSADWRVQNEFLLDLANGIYECIYLNSTDFSRIAQLNKQYRDLPGDFADLSLVAISERLNLEAIATLDSDFDIYRRYRSQPFVRVFLPN